MNEYSEMIEKALDEFLIKDNDVKGLVDSMEYSLMAGGKRIRPKLVLEFCKACGGNPENALSFACAIEMIHTYSLIHDDLPCMDNDDMRRGRPSNHCAFGEDTALLAGDALLTLAFETALSEKAVKATSAKAAADAGRILASFAGVSGMVGGQFIDLSIEGKKVEAETLEKMYGKKTGALLKASCMLGCIAAGADDEKLKAAEEFGGKIGLVFQIIDDVLDVVSTPEVLGKPILSDEENEKTTFMSIYGEEKCRQIAKKLTDDAVKALDIFGKDESAELRELAINLLNRNK